MARALTFDYWDTLYDGGALPARAVLRRTAVTPREQVAAVDALDNALLMLPPAMLAGAWPMLRAVRRHFTLAVISDTDVASARAQDRLLEKDAAREFFAATIYSTNAGHAKPRPEPFAAAAETLGVPPHEIIHIGDDERTDVHGALSAGFRAIRLDVVRHGGPSEAEFVARSFGELTEYLVGQSDSRTV